MLRKLLAIMLSLAAFAAARSEAITLDPFGPNGQGGSKNGQSFLIGPGGSVFEYDAFLYIQGMDLNGNQTGTSADLAVDPLPAGLLYSFSSALTNGGNDVVMTYSFTNTTTNVFSDVRFFAFLDAEIDQAINTFFNEYGTVTGAPGAGAGDAAPDQWQIDEPGFQTGTMLQNLFTGTLSNSNSVPLSAPNDVSMALGFSLGNMSPGGSNTVQILVSEVGDSLGAFFLTHRDADPASTTVITFSGSSLPNGIVTNAPPTNGVFANLSFNTNILMHINWTLNRPTGSLIGTLSITNKASSGISLGPPFQLWLSPTTNLYYVQATGTTNGSVTYLDFTPQMSALLGGGLLAAGQSVMMSNSVINVYSAGRIAPADANFQFWATTLK